uniref:Uncharacterized protein n=1 Tax=Cacopsylla melanoneura TaxID=428564 RepID=A0A8D9BSE9_9HEMI
MNVYSNMTSLMNSFLHNVIHRFARCLNTGLFLSRFASKFFKYLGMLVSRYIYQCLEIRTYCIIIFNCFDSKQCCHLGGEGGPNQDVIFLKLLIIRHRQITSDYHSDLADYLCGGLAFELYMRVAYVYNA